MLKAMKMLRSLAELADEQLKARGTLLLNTQSNLECWVEDACSILLFVSRINLVLISASWGLKFMHQVVRKRTRIVTPISDLAKALNAKQCTGKHTELF